MRIYNVYMKSKILTICFLIGLIIAAISCSEGETYADKKNKQNNAIAQYITDQKINVIDEDQFQAQDSTTIVDTISGINQYVLFKNTGVYMQILRKGTGGKLLHGKAAKLLVRFDEWNILGDSLTMSNRNAVFAYLPDEISVYNSYGVFTGSFTTGLMYSYYGSTYVPSAWLIPLTYINIGRQTSEDEEIAHVKLIVPADQGHEYASSYVVPYAYDLYITSNR